MLYTCLLSAKTRLAVRKLHIIDVSLNPKKTAHHRHVVEPWFALFMIQVLSRFQMHPESKNAGVAENAEVNTASHASSSYLLRT